MTDKQIALKQGDSDFCDDLVRIALDIGEGLLENGADCN